MTRTTEEFEWRSFEDEKLQAFGSAIYEAWRDLEGLGDYMKSGVDVKDAHALLQEVNAELKQRDLPTDITGYDCLVEPRESASWQPPSSDPVPLPSVWQRLLGSKH